MNADEFIANSKSSVMVFSWAISADPDSGEHILYYPGISNLQRCPYLRLHKDRIKDIEILFLIPYCFPLNSPTPIDHAVYATQVTLHPLDIIKDGDLYGALTALQANSKNEDGGSILGKNPEDDLEEQPNSNAVFGQCIYDGKTYTVGAVTCQDGKRMQCTNFSWGSGWRDLKENCKCGG